MPANEDEQNTEALFSPAEGDYAQMLDDYSHFAPPAEGEVLKATSSKSPTRKSLSISAINLKDLYPLHNSCKPMESVHVKPNDTIDVMMDRTGERPEGYVLLSHEKASRLRAWDDLDARNART